MKTENTQNATKWPVLTSWTTIGKSFLEPAISFKLLLKSCC